MDNYDKYLKYKSKYLKLKNSNKVSQSGGSNNKDDVTFYFGQDFVDDMKNPKPTIYLFKASWCGHCKNFRETWNSLGNTFSKDINFISYDSDKNPKAIREWNIKGFPTIIVRNDNTAKEYNGDRDIDSLVNYINTLIKN
jgi:thiol-disulfide isomerase/thioredoxin